MDEKIFHLTEEPWIRVRCKDNSVREVTLPEALCQAHTFAALGGELATQDVAALRLLLAVLHTVFSRVDENGAAVPLQSDADALTRWKTLWERGALPETPIRTYFAQWEERFWLFHPQYPFGQVPKLEKATEYEAAKLIGELSESSNKVRLCQMKTGTGKESVSFAEAARWLLYVNAYDDTSAKPKGKGLPSPGVGWLGKLGLIYAEGDSLFETLLLNLVLARPGQQRWGNNLPTWELEQPRTAERSEIPQPDNQAQLLTLQSRRLLLHRENERVIGYSLLGGDFFAKENAFIEQMTVWSRVKTARKDANDFQPRRHNPARQLWRDYASIFPAMASDGETQNSRPGVVRWIDWLYEKKYLSRQKRMVFRIAGVQYGDKDFFVTDVFGDALTFHSDLLSTLGRGWQRRVEQEVAKCDDAARAANRLEREIFLAAGGSESKKTEVPRLAEQLYDRLDAPFRRWLQELDPETCDVDEACEAWHQTARSIALQLGKERIEQVGMNAVFGRTLGGQDKGNGVKQHHSAMQAFFAYQGAMHYYYPKKEGSQ